MTAAATCAPELPIASPSVSTPIPAYDESRDGVERPVERREEPHVEDLHEHEDAQQRPGDHGQRAARGDGQQGGQRDDGEELERQPRERAGVQLTDPVRGDERGPHAQQGEDRERRADARGLGPAAAPQPPRALAHRRREQDERAGQERLHERVGQDPGGRDRQHDPLDRCDDPAPAAWRQRRAHPRQQPFAGHEHVARGPDREHPRAVLGGDVDAEGGDQERVDLAVEARAHRGRRPGAPRHRPVDRVEHERDGGERHEQRDGRVVRERVHGQHGDPGGEHRPRERHPRRRPQPRPARDRAHSSRNRGESA